jgi:hypothetical protein
MGAESSGVLGAEATNLFPILKLILNILLLPVQNGIDSETVTFLPRFGRTLQVACLSFAKLVPVDLHRTRNRGKVLSLTRRPRPAPQKHYFYASGTHFC